MGEKRKKERIFIIEPESILFSFGLLVRNTK
jgi:hypothetical protein